MKLILTILSFFSFVFLQAQSIDSLLVKFPQYISNGASEKVLTTTDSLLKILSKEEKQKYLSTIFFERANAKYQLGNYSGCILEAEKSLANMTSMDSTMLTKIRYKIAVANLQNGNNAEATKFLDMLIQEEEYLLKNNHRALLIAFQVKGIIFKRIGKPREAIDISKQALQSALKIEGYALKDIGGMYLGLGAMFQDLAMLDSASLYFSKCQKIYEKVYEPLHPENGILLINIGLIQLSEGQILVANKTFEKVEEIFLKSYGSNHPQLINVYTNRAFALSHLGNFEKALSYLNKSKTLYENSGNTRPDQLQPIYRNIGMIYSYMDRNEEAIKYFEKAWELNKSAFGESSKLALDAYHGVVDIYRRMKKYDKAIGGYQHLIQAYNPKEAPESLVKIHTDLAKVYIEINQYELAHQHLNTAFEIVKPLGDNFFKEELFVKIHLGNVLSLRGEFKKAQIIFEEIEQKIKDSENANKYFAFDVGLVFFEKFGNHLYRKYQDENDLKNLTNALEIYKEGVQKYLDWQSKLDRSKSKKSIAKQARNLMTNALNITYELYQVTKEQKYVDDAFLFTEYAKSFLLKSIWQNHQAAKTANVPDEIIAQESRLQNEIKNLSNEIERLTSSSKDEKAQFLEAQKKLFSFEKELEILMKKIEKDYPNYFSIKYQIQFPEPVIISNQLSEDAAVIEYSLHDSILYTFLFVENRRLFFRNKLPHDFSKKVKTYYNSISTPSGDFQKMNSFLYETLLQNVANHCPENIQQFTIVPDGILAYLPFETFFNHEENRTIGISEFQKSKSINYHWTAFPLPNNSNSPKNQLLGFAPEYQLDNFNSPTNMIASSRSIMRSGNLLPLPGAKAELEAIQNIFPSQVFFKDDANKSVFLNHASDFQFLHFSMHGIVDENNPLYSSLLFSQQDSTNDGQLYAWEISNLPLQAELAVLSACNTGFGKIEKGEGVMSLSRAFAYAGVPSTVMSLWKVPDASTSKIMVSFYENLKNGKSKPEALRQAKIDYLNQVDTIDEKHPYYWAGFVLMGNTEPVQLENTWNWWVVGLFSILAFAVISFLFFRKK